MDASDFGQAELEATMGFWYNGDEAQGGVLAPGHWWLAGMRALKGKSVQMSQDPGPDSQGIHIGPLENHGKPKETRLGREMKRF